MPLEILITVIAVPVLIVALLIALATYGYCKSRKAVANAPTNPPMAMLFTDVESSTRLWETYPADMATAMEIHHDIFRSVVEEFQCYEVKVVGDAFMIAAPTVLDAALLAVEAQRRLMDADWPADLVDWKAKEPATAKLAPEIASQQAFLNRGLRVRMGIHYCENIEPKYDAIHQRYDYYGPDVNQSARVQSVANGGQILMTAETARVLQENADWALWEDDMFLEPFAENVEFKGVAQPATVYTLLPCELSGRLFDEPPGSKKISPTGGENKIVGGGGSSLNTSSGHHPDDAADLCAFETQSMMSHGAQAATAAQHQESLQFYLGWVFDALESKLSRQTALDLFYDHAGIQNRRGGFKQRVTALSRSLAKAAEKMRDAGMLGGANSNNHLRANSLLPGGPISSRNRRSSRQTTQPTTLFHSVAPPGDGGSSTANDNNSNNPQQRNPLGSGADGGDLEIRIEDA